MHSCLRTSDCVTCLAANATSWLPEWKKEKSFKVCRQDCQKNTIYQSLRWKRKAWGPNLTFNTNGSWPSTLSCFNSPVRSHIYIYLYIMTAHSWERYGISGWQGEGGWGGGFLPSQGWGGKGWGINAPAPPHPGLFHSSLNEGIRTDSLSAITRALSILDG